jgi:hypothetical protein
LRIIELALLLLMLGPAVAGVVDLGSVRHSIALAWLRLALVVGLLGAHVFVGRGPIDFVTGLAVLVVIGISAYLNFDASAAPFFIFGGLLLAMLVTARKRLIPKA